MPTYPVKHKETGETKELSMTMIEYEKWEEDNTDWNRDNCDPCNYQSAITLE